MNEDRQHTPSDHSDDEHKTLQWWRLLKSLATLNLAVWCIASLSLGYFTDHIHHLTWWHLTLSGIYTAVCAFRSYLPRIDLERYVLSDRFASSMVFGRSAATIAEVCFAVQMKLFLDEISALAGVDWVATWSPIIIVLLCVAQVFCWLSVLTLNHLGHAIEEAIWGSVFVYIGVAICLCLPTLENIWWTVGVIGATSSWIYVIFMFSVDVPMYHRRWRQGQSEGVTTLTLGAGWRDALYRREHTNSWVIWRPEAMWLTGYFACAVWLSIGLSMLPR